METYALVFPKCFYIHFVPSVVTSCLAEQFNGEIYDRIWLTCVVHAAHQVVVAESKVAQPSAGKASWFGITSFHSTASGHDVREV